VIKTEATLIGLIVNLLGSLVFSTWVPASATAAGIPDPRFGVVEAHQAPQAATVLGAGWTRVTFEWNRIQPSSAEEWMSVPISDQTISSELAQGRQIVGLLNTTPGWATDAAIGPGVPKGLYLPTDDPNNLWAGYVRTIVARYAGRIDHWTIWNEPDIPTNSPDMSWGGSVDDFVRLLEVAYTVARETNPGAVIHMAAVTHWHDEHWFGTFLDALLSKPGAAGNGYYFDVVTLHLYHEPEKIYEVTSHYRRMIHGRGIYKPIWIAETNAYLSRVSPEEQAFFIFQAFSLEIAAGADRIAVYKMADVETDQAADPEPFGLVRMDGSRRPAFTAYQMATTYLAGFRGALWERRDAISLVTVDRGNRTTTVVWARTPESQTAMIPARKTRALLVDAYGGARYIHPERGYYYVDLPGANCAQGCQIGGAPYMLVEDAPAAANTAPTPQSPTPGSPDTMEPPGTAQLSGTPGATAAVSPSPTATPTPEAQPSPTPSASATLTAAPTVTPWPSASATATSSPTHVPTITSTATPLPVPTASATLSANTSPIGENAPVPSPTAAVTSARSISDATRGSRSWILVAVLTLSLGAMALSARGGRT